jgi:hypothetical protein
VELRVVCPVCGLLPANRTHKNSSVAASWHFISTYKQYFFFLPIQTILVGKIWNVQNYYDVVIVALMMA